MVQVNDKVLTEFQNVRESLKLTCQQHYTNDFITVGDFTYGVPKVCFWDDKTKLTIGKFCSIAENVTIMLGGEHCCNWVSTYPFNALMPENFSFIKGHPKTKGDIVIGNDVWIANGAKIMSGVTIGDGAVIGANALLTKNVPPYSIVGGVPAKVIKYRYSKRIIKELESIQWWNWSDSDICNVIEYLQSENIKMVIDYYHKTIQNSQR